MKGALCAFKTGLEKLNRLIWRSAEPPSAPQTTDEVAQNFIAAPRRVFELLESAVRAGVQATLMSVVSWYPNLELHLLGTLRAGSDADLNAAWPQICNRATVLVDAIDPLEYTPCLEAKRTPVQQLERRHTSPLAARSGICLDF